MKSLIRMLKYMKPYRREAIIALLLLVGVVGADLSIPRLTQRVIDEGESAEYDRDHQYGVAYVRRRAAGGIDLGRQHHPFGARGIEDRR